MVQGALYKAREKDRVNFRGVAEHINYELKGRSPLIHRRVIFSAHDQIPESDLLLGPKGQLCRRRALPSCDLRLQVQRTLFGGCGGDMTDQYVAKLDSKVCTVHNDVTLPINPSGIGHYRVIRRFVDISKELVYRDCEAGAGAGGWAATTSPLGNVYCMDIFSNRAGGDGSDDEGGEDESVVSSQCCVYWGE